jgi:hypothetical protein
MDESAIANSHGRRVAAALRLADPRSEQPSEKVTVECAGCGWVMRPIVTAQTATAPVYCSICFDREFE